MMQDSELPAYSLQELLDAELNNISKKLPLPDKELDLSLLISHMSSPEEVSNLPWMIIEPQLSSIKRQMKETTCKSL